MIRCNYCGAENEDGNQVCVGCGTPPNCGPDGVPCRPPRPTIGGLLDAALGLIKFGTGHPAGLLHMVPEFELGEDENSPHALLERAASLESSDLRAAASTYVRILKQYPEAKEAREAMRNLRTIRAAHPELMALRPPGVSRGPLLPPSAR